MEVVKVMRCHRAGQPTSSPVPAGSEREAVGVGSPALHTIICVGTQRLALDQASHATALYNLTPL